MCNKNPDIGFFHMVMKHLGPQGRIPGPFYPRKPGWARFIRVSHRSSSWDGGEVHE